MVTELGSLGCMKVNDDMKMMPLMEKYFDNGNRPELCPSLLFLVRKQLADQMAVVSNNAIVCVCGIFEHGSVGNDLINRAEVPSTFELNTTLALGIEKGWSVGFVDIMASFCMLS